MSTPHKYIMLLKNSVCVYLVPCICCDKNTLIPSENTNSAVGLVTQTCSALLGDEWRETFPNSVLQTNCTQALRYVVNSHGNIGISYIHTALTYNMKTGTKYAVLLLLL